MRTGGVTTFDPNNCGLYSCPHVLFFLLRIAPSFQLRNMQLETQMAAWRWTLMWTRRITDGFRINVLSAYPHDLGCPGMSWLVSWSATPCGYNAKNQWFCHQSNFQHVWKLCLDSGWHFLSLIMYTLFIKHGNGRSRSFHRNFIAGKNRTKWGIFQQTMFDYLEGIM